jgi:hypothetical protein
MAEYGTRSPGAFGICYTRVIELCATSLNFMQARRMAAPLARRVQITLRHFA